MNIFRPVIPPTDVPRVPLITLAPTTAPSSCSICGEGKEVGELDTIFAFPGQPPISCGDLEQDGQNGQLPDGLSCRILSIIIDNLCDCQISISSAAPTSIPSSAPTKVPIITTGAPILTEVPTTISPTETPTLIPITEAPMTAQPISYAPAYIIPTETPTSSPVTREPTRNPTTLAPVTGSPITFAPAYIIPTETPTTSPVTGEPTGNPTNIPTETPTTSQATGEPTGNPTNSPTETPTVIPVTEAPVIGSLISFAPAYIIPTETPTTTPVEKNFIRVHGLMKKLSEEQSTDVDSIFSAEKVNRSPTEKVNNKKKEKGATEQIDAEKVVKTGKATEKIAEKRHKGKPQKTSKSN